MFKRALIPGNNAHAQNSEDQVVFRLGTRLGGGLSCNMFLYDV